MDAFLNWLADLSNRMGDYLARHFDLLRDPESMIGLFIVTLWSVFAGAFGGWVAILIILFIAWVLHFLAVESGNHVVLWLTTVALLVLIVISSAATFNGLSPILLAAAGSTALVHNELVRINYTRRRNAVVHPEVFHASGIGLAAAAGIAVAGVTVSAIASDGSERSWLWMPAAVGVLMLVGFGLAIGPARRASQASKERWQPGDRIPPQPLGSEDLEHF